MVGMSNSNIERWGVKICFLNAKSTLFAQY